MLVYLDTCALQRPLDDWTQLRVRVEAEAVLGVLAAVERGEIELLCADVLRFETANNPLPSRRDFALRVFDKSTRYVRSTPDVSERALSFEREGIKPMDAVHLASAVVAHADFFCTTDDKLCKKGKTANTRDTRVVSPLELIPEIPS